MGLSGGGMANESFFEKQEAHSRVKSLMVSEYFDAWANVIINPKRGPKPEKIAYFDLFAGPGVFEDGSPSTPLLVLKKAVAKGEYSERLISVFNDANLDNVNALKKEVGKLAGISNLAFKPVFLNNKVDEDTAEHFKSIRLVPTLSFLDPFGYKGLSLDLLDAFLKDWGCDCIFFFNYKRINMHLSNDLIPAVNKLFGEDRAAAIRKRIKNLRASDRELTILDEFNNGLVSLGYMPPLSFRFMSATGKRTSHFLMLVSKNFKAYNIMKRIMNKYSSSEDCGIPTFEFNPAIEKIGMKPLFGDRTKLEVLKKEVYKVGKGRVLKVPDLINMFPAYLPYLESNYKDALRELEQEGAIGVDPPSNKRQKRDGKVTFGPKVTLDFTKGTD